MPMTLTMLKRSVMTVLCLSFAQEATKQELLRTKGNVSAAKTLYALWMHHTYVFNSFVENNFQPSWLVGW